MKLTEGVTYMVAQVIGGIGGAYLLYWMFTTSPSTTSRKQGLGTDGYGKQSLLHVNQSGAFLIEVVLTAIFVSVVLFATHKAAIQGAAGVAIGFALVMVHLIGIPLTGTSVNPARSTGAGAGGRGHGAQPGLALHRGPARRADSWPRSSTWCWPTAPRTRSSSDGLRGRGDDPLADLLPAWDRGRGDPGRRPLPSMA